MGGTANYSGRLEKCCETPSPTVKRDDNVTVRVGENFPPTFLTTTISHHFNIQKMSSIFLVVVSFSSTCIFIGNLISLSSLPIETSSCKPERVRRRSSRKRRIFLVELAFRWLLKAARRKRANLSNKNL